MDIIQKAIDPIQHISVFGEPESYKDEIFEVLAV